MLHSSYFRTFLEQLTDGQRVYSADECNNHPDIAHCFRLPDNCDKVEASVDDFRVFPCHLYFTERDNYLPYKAASRVNLTAQSAPAVTLSWPGVRDVEELRKATPSELYDFSSANVCESVVSLCHYSDCSCVLSRAETSMVLVVEKTYIPSSCYQSEAIWKLVWPCFLFALKFDLRRVKTACMPLLARCCKYIGGQKEEWEKIMPQLDKETLYEMLQATFTFHKV